MLSRTILLILVMQLGGQSGQSISESNSLLQSLHVQRMARLSSRYKPCLTLMISLFIVTSQFIFLNKDLIMIVVIKITSEIVIVALDIQSLGIMK